MEVPAQNEMGTALRTIIFSSVFSSKIVSPPTIKCASIAKPDLGACSGWHLLVALVCAVQGCMQVPVSANNSSFGRKEIQSSLRRMESSVHIHSSHCAAESTPPPPPLDYFAEWILSAWSFFPPFADFPPRLKSTPFPPYRDPASWVSRETRSLPQIVLGADSGVKA